MFVCFFTVEVHTTGPPRPSAALNIAHVTIATNRSEQHNKNKTIFS